MKNDQPRRGCEPDPEDGQPAAASDAVADDRHRVDVVHAGGEKLAPDAVLADADDAAERPADRAASALDAAVPARAAPGCREASAEKPYDSICPIVSPAARA